MTRIDIDTNRAIRMNLTTGKFGGTAIGDGLTLEGRIDLKDVLKASYAYAEYESKYLWCRSGILRIW